MFFLSANLRKGAIAGRSSLSNQYLKFNLAICCPFSIQKAGNAAFRMWLPSTLELPLNLQAG